MPRFYVEKDGEWNIFSTIIDGFVFDEFVCLDALKARLLYERYKELTEDIDSLLTDRPRVNVMSYSDAIERIGEDEQTEPQTEGIWNAGYKTGYDKGYKDAQKVKDSQDLVKDLVKTENSSEKPNNCEDLQDWKDRMWAEAIVTEPTTQTKTQNSNKNSNVISVYDGVSEAVRCAMCSNPNKSDRGCDGACSYDEKLYERIMKAIAESVADTPQTDCGWK